MAATPRVGFAGMTHDHVWGLAPGWSELDVELVAAADPNGPLRDRMSREFGVSRTYDGFEDMFAAEDLDIVTVCLDNAHHADVVEAALPRESTALLRNPWQPRSTRPSGCSPRQANTASCS